mgnify:CR=1 FL=1
MAWSISPRTSVLTCGILRLSGGCRCGRSSRRSFIVLLGLTDGGFENYKLESGLCIALIILVSLVGNLALRDDESVALFNGILEGIECVTDKTREPTTVDVIAFLVLFTGGHLKVDVLLVLINLPNFCVNFVVN